MSNTQKRVISAIVMMAIVSLCFYFGKTSTLIFLLIASIIVIDEIYVNFLKKRRFNLNYFISQVALVGPFIFLNFLETTIGFKTIIFNAGIVLNVLLMHYLFFQKMDTKSVKRITKMFPFSGGIFVSIYSLSFSTIFFYENWRGLIFVIMLISFGMDTGAWFFGKNFGKNKLWPAVSPNKTIEGFLGGTFVATLLSSLLWFYIHNNQISWLICLVFAIVAMLSQVGDLIQSKLKRQFEIKDSSALIPGHGGVYDRVDSLFFVAPFFASLLQYYYH